MKILCAYTKLVPISEIKYHPKNPNIHPQTQIKKLAEDIKCIWFRDAPIVSKRSGFLITGHGRVEALRVLGETEVPIQEQDFESARANTHDRS